MTNKRNGTLYIGVTNNIIRRVSEHREGIFEGFTKKFGLKRLVFYEIHGNIEFALAREKQLKRWKRDWKIELIEKSNPEWLDLYDSLF